MNEHKIINEIKNGNQDNFQHLIQKYHNMMYKIINSFELYKKEYLIEKEDLYQVACMALYEACLSFKENKGSSFSTFAYVVMKRKIMNTYREYINISNYETDSFDDKETYFYIPSNSSISDPKELFYQEDFQQKALALFNKLSKEDKDIINLRLENLPYKEIGKRLNITSKRVDNRIYSIRKAIDKYVLERESVNNE